VELHVTIAFVVRSLFAHFVTIGTYNKSTYYYNLRSSYKALQPVPCLMMMLFGTHPEPKYSKTTMLGLSVEVKPVRHEEQGLGQDT
jgi:hypothetical protein